MKVKVIVGYYCPWKVFRTYATFVQRKPRRFKLMGHKQHDRLLPEEKLYFQEVDIAPYSEHPNISSYEVINDDYDTFAMYGMDEVSDLSELWSTLPEQLRTDRDMIRAIEFSDIPTKPYSRTVHVVEIPDNVRWAHISDDCGDFCWIEEHHRVWG